MNRMLFCGVTNQRQIFVHFRCYKDIAHVKSFIKAENCDLFCATEAFYLLYLLLGVSITGGDTAFLCITSWTKGCSCVMFSTLMTWSAKLFLSPPYCFLSFLFWLYLTFYIYLSFLCLLCSETHSKFISSFAFFGVMSLARSAIFLRTACLILT